MSENRAEITPAQCRAARALLNLTQRQVAEAAGVSPASLEGFERSQRAISSHLIAAMRRALETAGVEFTNGDEQGVKLRKDPDRLGKWMPDGSEFQT